MEANIILLISKYFGTQHLGYWLEFDKCVIQISKYYDYKKKERDWINVIYKSIGITEWNFWLL